MAELVLATTDAQLLELFQGEISGMGHTLHWAANGYVAIDLVLQRRPLAIFLDAPLEVFGVFETATQLRADPEAPAELRIFYLSDAPESPQQLEKAGINACFPRTHTHQELRECIGTLLEAHSETA